MLKVQVMPAKSKVYSAIWEYYEVVQDNEEVCKARCLECGLILNCHLKKKNYQQQWKH